MVGTTPSFADYSCSTTVVEGISLGLLVDSLERQVVDIGQGWSKYSWEIEVVGIDPSG